MPFVVISDPVEAHRYRQAGMLWFYSRTRESWVPLGGLPLLPLKQQMDNMCVNDYAILVEEEDE